MPGSVYFVSLGCPKNFVDTELLAGSLLSAGWQLEFEPEYADLYVVNTCAFLPAARREAEDAIKTALKWKKRTGGAVVVAGCLSQYDRENGDYAERYPDVDVWTTPDEVGRFSEILSGGERSSNALPVYIYDHKSPRLQLTLPHFAYLKIADGCNNRCAYCAIPSIRGGLRSRPSESVIKEAENLISSGVRELVIIAQDVTAYGHDRPESGDTLASLLKKLETLDGDFVMRLLYTHPAHYTGELIDYLAGSAKTLPYLDIPLQHINDNILRRMGRKTTSAATRKLLADLRKNIPRLVLRSTFIAGLPGEGEEEFKELCDFVEEQRFERAGVFAYSPEKGTPAADMPDRADAETVRKRVKKIMKMQEKIMAECQQSEIGKIHRVLIDCVDGKTSVGRSFMDAPEIDNRIVIRAGKKLKAGEFYNVKIVDGDRFQLWGELQ